MNRLKGRVALVTGGSRGIGRAICLAFAREGATVVVNYQRQRSAADEVVEEIRAIGAEGFAAQADITEEEQVGALVSGVSDRYGKLDVLVNNTA